MTTAADAVFLLSLMMCFDVQAGRRKIDIEKSYADFASCQKAGRTLSAERYLAYLRGEVPNNPKTLIVCRRVVRGRGHDDMDEGGI